MTSSPKIFSFYGAAALAESSHIGGAAPAGCSMEEVDIVGKDGSDVDEEREEEAEATSMDEPGGSSVGKLIDRATALNEIRKLLNEEIEQDSGE